MSLRSEEEDGEKRTRQVLSERAQALMYSSRKDPPPKKKKKNKVKSQA